MSQDLIDYTGRLCDRFPNAHDGNEWPMYSFDRPAFMFWNGFANGLKRLGLTDEQIKDELQSKGPRWMLDNCDEIEKLGLKMAAKYHLCVTER